VATVDPTVRTAWIQHRLARTAGDARLWLHAWELGIAGATVADLAFIPILGNTKSVRIDFGLGAATTVVGILPLALWQPQVLGDHEALDARVARGDADPCALVADAERRLVSVAAAQRQQRAWYWHAGNVVINAGVTLLFGAFHHWGSGVANGAFGVAIGELIIFTEPVAQIDDLARYRRGDLANVAHATWHLAPTAGPHSAGLSFSYGWP
jgi:hypothetical protein